jgi:hypothetical protein
MHSSLTHVQIQYCTTCCGINASDARTACRFYNNLQARARVVLALLPQLLLLLLLSCSDTEGQRTCGQLLQDRRCYTRKADHCVEPKLSVRGLRYRSAPTQDQDNPLEQWQGPRAADPCTAGYVFKRIATKRRQNGQSQLLTCPALQRAYKIDLAEQQHVQVRNTGTFKQENSNPVSAGSAARPRPTPTSDPTTAKVCRMQPAFHIWYWLQGEDLADDGLPMPRGGQEGSTSQSQALCMLLTQATPQLLRMCFC